KRDARVVAQLPILHAAPGGVEAHVGAVPVHPHRCHLRRAVTADRRQVRERLLREEVPVLFGNRRHGETPFFHSSWKQSSAARAIVSRTQPCFVVSSTARASASARIAKSRRTRHCWTSTASCVNGSATQSRAHSPFSLVNPSVGESFCRRRSRSSGGSPLALSLATVAARTAAFQMPVKPSINAA